MNLRSFCSENGIGYRELVIDDGLINKVYELSFPPDKRGLLLGVPDGCIDVQVVDTNSEEKDFVAGSYLQGRRSAASDYEWCFGIKFVPGLEYSFSKIEAPALLDTRLEAGSLFDIDALQDIAHLPLDFETRARLAAQYFGVENRDDFFHKSDVLVAFITKAIFDSGGIIRIEDIVERTGYSHRYVASQFKGVVGCTMKTFANIIRIQNAIKLLSDERYRCMTGLDIGTGLGYFDQSHFDKQFKKHTTLTPSEVRSGSTSMLFM